MALRYLLNLLVFIGISHFYKDCFSVFAKRESSNSDPELVKLHEEDKRYKTSPHKTEEALCSGHYHLSEHRAKFGSYTFTSKNGPEKGSPTFQTPNETITRIELISKLKEQGFNGWAVELGVANGEHAREIIRRSSFSRVFAVDAWTGKAIKRRRLAIHNLLPKKNCSSCLIWAYFEQAAALFLDASFDYIYVDGFAGDGELGGFTFDLFFPKVRPGGIFAGHDYDKRWPKVMAAVNNFVVKNDLELHIMPNSEQRWDRFSSWYVVVPGNFQVNSNLKKSSDVHNEVLVTQKIDTDDEKRKDSKAVGKYYAEKMLINNYSFIFFVASVIPTYLLYRRRKYRTNRGVPQLCWRPGCRL